MRTIAVDFDGTLVKDEFPHIGPLIEKNAQILQDLNKNGYSIVIFSARLKTKPKDKVKIEKFLRENDVPFKDVTHEKPYQATVFIDDRAIKVGYNQEWPDNLVEQIETIIVEHKKETKAYINFNRILRGVL